jgi:hypothetical protein
MNEQATAPAMSNRDFLEWIFGDQWPRAHVTTIKGDPRKAVAADWAGFAAGNGGLNRLKPDANNYYSVSLFRGALRRMQYFDGMFILGIDDIGPKVDARRALTLLGRPHYRLETSPGNEQWGYRLSPPIPDLMDATNAQVRLVDLLFQKLRSADTGQKAVTRYFRLPVGANGKIRVAAP